MKVGVVGIDYHLKETTSDGIAQRIECECLNTMQGRMTDEVHRSLDSRFNYIGKFRDVAIV